MSHTPRTDDASDRCSICGLIVVVPSEMKKLEHEHADLLDALKRIAALPNLLTGCDWGEIAEARGIARTAIAKAEGK